MTRPSKDSAKPTAAFVGGPAIRRVIARWGPVFFWMGLIFLLSSLSAVPRVPEELLDTLLKKAAHVGEYAVLGALMYRALRREGGSAGNSGAAEKPNPLTLSLRLGSGRGLSKGGSLRLRSGQALGSPRAGWKPLAKLFGRIPASTVLSTGLAGIYGISDELHQALVPGRNPSPVDVGIDTVGALAGSWALTLWRAARR